MKIANYLQWPLRQSGTKERLHNYLRDLKRTSDALFKALNSREPSLRKFKAKQLEEEPSDSAVEENEIASNMSLEREDN